MIKTLNDINPETQEGLLLISALALLHSTAFQHSTPEELIALITLPLTDFIK